MVVSHVDYQRYPTLSSMVALPNALRVASLRPARYRLTIGVLIASFSRRNSSQEIERIMNELDKRRRKKLQSKIDKDVRIPRLR